MGTMSNLSEFRLTGQAAAEVMEIIGTDNVGALDPTVKAESLFSRRRTENIARLARQWFLEAMNHPLWKTYMREAPEDEGFYIGGDLQWSHEGSLEDLRALRARNRTTVTRNHIQPIVDVLTGFERQNQYDLKAVAQGQHDIDADDAEQLSWLLKFVQDQTNCQEVQSEVFEDGIIRGMAAVEVGINWQNDPVNGEIEVKRLQPGIDVVWDPHWKEYDLSDARYVIKFKWLYVEDVVAQYPEHEALILAALDSLDLDMGYALGNNETSQGEPANPYGGVTNHPTEDIDSELIMYDPLGRRLLVLEVYHRTYTIAWVCVNAESGQKQECATLDEAEKIIAADPVRWRKEKRTKRIIRRGVVIPATVQTLEEDDDTPYENDTDAYPIVPYVAKRKGRHVYGVVRNLKDPQRVENKKMSQILDILGRYANMRMMYQRGSIEDPRQLEVNSTAPLAVNPTGTQMPPTYLVPPLGDLLNALVGISANNEQVLKTISGINTDLLGQKADDTSGIAIARRQAQGQTIATVYFDNLKRTRRLMGQRLAKRVQQVMTTEQVMRLTDRQTGETRTVMLNPLDAKRFSDDKSYQDWRNKQRDAGRPFVLRDVSALKFDVTISESPSTPSARQTALLALLEIAGKFPPVIPAILEQALKLADIPDRQDILARVARIPEVAALAQDPQPQGPPPQEPPRVSLSLRAEVDPKTALQLAAGQPPDPEAVEIEHTPTLGAAQIRADAQAAQPAPSGAPGEDPAAKAAEKAADRQAQSADRAADRAAQSADRQAEREAKRADKAEDRKLKAQDQAVKQSIAGQQAAATTATRARLADAKVKEGIVRAGQPSVSGVTQSSGSLPLPAGVVANPATPDNPRVALPQDAGFTAGGPPPYVPRRAPRRGRL